MIMDGIVLLELMMRDLEMEPLVSMNDAGYVHFVGYIFHRKSHEFSVYDGFRLLIVRMDGWVMLHLIVSLDIMKQLEHELQHRVQTRKYPYQKSRNALDSINLLTIIYTVSPNHKNKSVH